jgi:adenylate cyclase
MRLKVLHLPQPYKGVKNVYLHELASKINLLPIWDGANKLIFEKEIDIDEAKELLKICEPGAIRKTRHQIKVGRHIFEVDEFHDKNEGLIVAEIELVSENEEFEKPDWLGEEVTGQQKYYNAQLSLSPYLEW